MTTTTIELTQRVYINAFPKAGTHLAESMIAGVLPFLGGSWLGNLTDHAFTNRPSGNDDKILQLCELWPPVGYLKGHMSHSKDIVNALFNGSICTLFVYRNLRDVAVSNAYHVLDERRDSSGEYVLKHSNKAVYQALDSFEDVLIAVINGIDIFPSLAKRWRIFRPWLDEPWVLDVRFEHMVNYPEPTAARMARYIFGQSAAFGGIMNLQMSKALQDDMIQRMVAGQAHKGPTYRNGKPDAWRDVWSERVEDAWRRSGAYKANERLGYEL